MEEQSQSPVDRRRAPRPKPKPNGQLQASLAPADNPAPPKPDVTIEKSLMLSAEERAALAPLVQQIAPLEERLACLRLGFNQLCGFYLGTRGLSGTGEYQIAPDLSRLIKVK